MLIILFMVNGYTIKRRRSYAFYYYCIHSNLVITFNPTATRKAKIVYKFGLSGCNGVLGTFPTEKKKKNPEGRHRLT